MVIQALLFLLDALKIKKKQVDAFVVNKNNLILNYIISYITILLATNKSILNIK